jgi:hypothetical protein
MDHSRGKTQSSRFCPYIFAQIIHQTQHHLLASYQNGGQCFKHQFPLDGLVFETQTKMNLTTSSGRRSLD